LYYVLELFLQPFIFPVSFSLANLVDPVVHVVLFHLEVPVDLEVLLLLELL
jgi:hypothetical protein